MAKELLKKITLAALLASAIPTFGQNILIINTEKNEERKRIEAGANYDIASEISEPMKAEPWKIKYLGINQNPYATTKQNTDLAELLKSEEGALTTTNYNDAIMAIIILGEGRLADSRNHGYNIAEYNRIIKESQGYVKAGLRFLQEDINLALNTGNTRTNAITLPALIGDFEKFQRGYFAEKDFCDSMIKKAKRESIMPKNPGKKVYDNTANNLYRKLGVLCGARSKELETDIARQQRIIDQLKKQLYEKRKQDRIAGKIDFR